MRIAEPDQPIIPLPSISDDFASRRCYSLNERFQIRNVNIRHQSHPDSPTSLTTDLHGDANPTFIPHHAGAVSADPSSNHDFIDFDCPGQKISIRPNHGAAKLMQTTPGSLVAS